jgi:hypothetical protein
MIQFFDNGEQESFEEDTSFDNGEQETMKDESN